MPDETLPGQNAKARSYPLNAWYMAAWADEVTEKPLGRKLLDRKVVLFRGQSGEAAALADMCPHRFAPLSLGRVNADTLSCPYHGLEFDRTGVCVRNPGGNGHFPPGTQVQSFPLIERHRILWIWMGDAASADPDAIPDLDQVPPAGKGAQNLGNHMVVRANYLIEIDNIMDLTHVSFLHDGSLGNATMRAGEIRTRDEGAGIRSDLWMPGTVVSFGEREGLLSDQWLDVLWMPPATMTLEFGGVAPGEKRHQDPHGIAFHIFTPETEETTHYFFGSSCAYPEDEAWKAEIVRSAQIEVFQREDNPIVETIQQNMAGSDFWSMRPAILPSDVAAIRVRRRLEQMVRKEMGEAAPFPHA